MTVLKSILFLILAPGTVAGFIPLGLLRTGSQMQLGFLSYLAFPLWLIGIAMLVWCFWDFVQKGKGTPAPTEPPKELVVTGLYNHVRNPMYVGIASIIIGHFLWFGFWNLLIYTAVVVIAFHSFVTLYEEPNLRQRFGAAYEEYLTRVPRWIPRVK
ncbi:MAG: isoprenylcysteine carboxylmethyltransferase family protein [Chloroflexota bacterium]